MLEHEAQTGTGASRRASDQGVALRPILVAEDNPDDLFFLKLALKRLNFARQVVAFENGQILVAYLTAQIAKPDGELPCLIFLDIKMPRMSGFDVLAWMRSQSALSGIRTVMLSGSAAATDTARANELGASDYLVKPPTTTDLERVLQGL